MRKILQTVTLAFGLVIQSGIPLAAALAVAAHPAAAQPTLVRPLQLDTNSPHALSAPRLDFNAERIAARQRLAEIEQAKLVAQSQDITHKLAAAGLKTDYAPLYLMASRQTGTPWQLIAAVHKIESNQRGNTTVASYAGAQGPMQFMPGTWVRYALDGNGDGVKSIHDVADAILTGANYLRAGGADKGNFYQALFNYNHADWYVQKVLAIAKPLGLP
jgi:membrane-bound lytic murein transglycosylase B